MEKIKTYIYKLLRSSERYTKTDMVYATKSGFWLMSHQVLSAFTSLVLSIMFAYFLSKETFGTYRYIISIAAIFGAFSLTGMNSAVVRAVAQGFGGILKRSVNMQMRWSILQIILSIGCSVYYFYNGNVSYAICFIIVAICAPLSAATNTYNAYLGGKKDFKRSATFGNVSVLLNFIFIAIACAFYPTIITLITAYYVSSLITNIYFYTKTLQIYKDENQDLREDDLAYGKSLSFMNIISSIAQHIDSIIIYKLLGPAQLAIYNYATLIPERIRTMFGIIATSASPKLAVKDPNDTQNLLQKIIRLLLLSILIAIIYILLAPFIYKILFPQYIDSTLYSQVFALSLLVIASNLSLPQLFVHKKQRELYIISVGLPIIKIITSVVGILFWGIWGAIVSKILHYIFHVAFSTYLVAFSKSQTHNTEIHSPTSL